MSLTEKHHIHFNCALSYLGSDVVDWLYSHVEGFQDRREARKYACNLLKVIVCIIV